MSNPSAIWGFLVGLIGFQVLVQAEESGGAFGPVWEHFPLSLEDGRRTEALGPFFYDEESEDAHTWAIPPLFSSISNPGTDSAELDFLYPIITYSRFGQEYRFQILQLFSLAGGGLQESQSKDRFTLFPIYFQQRSTVSNENYTALFPIYGKLRNRLFRDEIDFVLWPLYVKTKRRPGAGSVGADEFLSIGNRWAQSRRGDITTYNFIAPIFHLRYGDGLRGWQAWPLAGHELKTVTLRTNAWGDTESIPGFKKSFVLWPIWLQDYRNMGSTNESHYDAVLPFYAAFRSPARDSTSYLWPFGLTLTEDRARKYDEVDFLWPVFAYARGEGKTTTRFWPLFGFSHNSFMERNFCAWPVYRYSRIQSEPLDRRRTQILFFLYSDKRELNTTTGNETHRVDCWPLFTSKHDGKGNSSLQVLSILEPVLAASKSIERNYSQVWSIWRSEKSTSRGTSSKSLLWNLYSSRVTQDGVRKTSFLFGLFQCKSSPAGSGLKLLYIPLSRIPEERGDTVDSAAPLAQPAPGAADKH